MPLAALLERAASLASLDLQRDGFVPSALQRGEIIDISNRISELLMRSTSEAGDLPALYAQASKQLAPQGVSAVNLSIVSPVRRLPPELLTSIFFEVAPGSPFDRGPLLARTVACVCFTWRTVVLGMPLLWSYISSERMSPLDSYAAQIRRSGDLPLHLRHWQWTENGPRAELLKLLRLHAARWASIEITSSCATLKAQPMVELPLLRTACICIEGPAMGPKVHTPLHFLTNAPTLIDLTVRLLGGKAMSIWSLVAIPPFPHLTTLDILIEIASWDHPPYTAILAAMQSCMQTLTTLTLDIIGDFHEGSRIRQSDGSLLRLEILGDLCLMSRAAEVFLPAIESPVLHRLVLAKLPNADYTQLPALLDFLSRQSLRVKGLILEDLAAGEEEMLIRCFERLDGLEELHVIELYSSALLPVLRQLTVTKDQRPLLPKLTTVVFRFQDQGAHDRVEDALKEMVASREQSGRGVEMLRDVEIIVGA
ncbi:uncharacterized protein SCHCODRAFT_02581965 [Schizophyllum commune H4-8]|uniref:uncharacterized protein n=1 Tax=Schizophyllum commune (strain H4-8 / FGSC 9210) TaxID=578458 RepID=UPI00215F9A0E|nr:uncharacterized protein SCHCODRAFT_02581965 [Schizophyllum commune H4-8]KAI5891800.1 hypothetical protein SCHCODRAFT_02581965 [Schizophyllum commune H4-8]